MTWGWEVETTINPMRNREGSGCLGNCEISLVLQIHDLRRVQRSTRVYEITPGEMWKFKIPAIQLRIFMGQGGISHDWDSYRGGIGVV